MRYFFDPCICVMTMCACKFDKWLALPRCAEQLGIPYKSKDLHKAKDDVKLATLIWSNLSAKIKAA